MLLIIIGLIFAVIGAMVAIAGLTIRFPNRFMWAFGMVACGVGLFMIFVPSAVDIGDTQTGIISKTIGQDLPQSKVVAVDGEKGPQAEVLGPGWHFGYWPWKYEITKVDTIVIPAGSLGVVNALDGHPPRTGWSSPPSGRTRTGCSTPPPSCAGRASAVRS